MISHPLLFLWPSSLCKILCSLPDFFHADRRWAIFLGFIEGSSFPLQLHQNLKQQQGPHKNLLFDCPSSCWVLLWKVTGFSHGSALIFKTPVKLVTNDDGVSLCCSVKGAHLRLPLAFSPCLGSLWCYWKVMVSLRYSPPWRQQCGPLLVLTSCCVLKMSVFSMK